MEKLLKNILFIGRAENKNSELSLIRSCLEKKGIKVDFNFQSQDTGNTLLKDNYDVILLDFEINGAETSEILKNTLKLKPQICIIILANEENKHYNSECMKAGAFDFLVKPDSDLTHLEHSINHSFLHSVIIGELRESEAKYKDLIEHLPAMFYISEINPPYSQIYASPLFDKFGYQTEEWLQVKNMWSDIIHPDDKQWVLAETDRAMKCGKETDYEYRIIGKDNTVFWVHDRGHFYHAADGKTIYWQGLMSDITERKNALEQLEHKLRYDDLTNLKNRRSFVEKLETALSEFKENPLRKFAVFLLDMDRFKVINDSLGHLIGDQFLISAGRRLENIIGDKGLVARLSGDEFAVLIEDAQDVEEVERIAKEVCLSLALPVNLDGYELSASVSIGVTISDENQKTVSEVLRNADLAMYNAKSSGKNCCKFYDEHLYSNNLRLVQLENGLRSALEKNELTLNYQPIISLKTGKVCKIESLLRWNHSDLGNVQPSEFIPIAEESGLIIPIGEWILEESCKQLSKFQIINKSEEDLVMSINISAKQIVKLNFIEYIKSILKKYNLKPQNLCLEITESSLMEKGDFVLESINTLHDFGVQFSTDDFGKGYSSLSYLHKFPFDELKIDSSFIGNLESNHKSCKIVRSIIDLARSLGLKTVAEGVETKEQMEKLIEYDCDFAQGYYFAKPMHPEGIESILVLEVQGLLQKGFRKETASLHNKTIELSHTLSF
jgi:diguanylate cyclase (GGDEF)-like protein/PAS domain S-box-containing protein